MIQFVKSLPIVKDGTLQVFFNETPAGNEMTTAQVATAKKKGWNVLMRKDYTWVDYPGEAGAIDENIFGDINGDGEVDVTDVVELIDMVLAGSTDPAGDINGDGEVDVTDVVELIDMVLSGT